MTDLHRLGEIRILYILTMTKGPNTLLRTHTAVKRHVIIPRNGTGIHRHEYQKGWPLKTLLKGYLTWKAAHRVSL